MNIAMLNVKSKNTNTVSVKGNSQQLKRNTLNLKSQPETDSIRFKGNDEVKRKELAIKHGLSEDAPWPEIHEEFRKAAAREKGLPETASWDEIFKITLESGDDFYLES